MTNTISLERLHAIMSDAGQHGDTRTVDDCSVVLHGADDETSQARVDSALARLVRTFSRDAS